MYICLIWLFGVGFLLFKQCEGSHRIWRKWIELQGPRESGLIRKLDVSFYLFTSLLVVCLQPGRLISQHVRERDRAFGDMFSFEGHSKIKGSNLKNGCSYLTL